jgi:hypothetical protein
LVRREERAMLLTRKELHQIIRDWRIGPIPRELENELLDIYGHELVTEEGLILEYSEQDIAQGLRQSLSPYSLLMHSGDPPALTASKGKEGGNDI